MSSADKTKLDSVAANATNYTHPVNHPPSIITQDASNRFVTDAEIASWDAKQPAGTYATGTGSASGTNTGDETTESIKTKLSITTLSGSNTGDQTLESLGAQATLVSDSNIKTVGGISLLGSGNIPLSGVSAFAYDDRGDIRSLTPSADDLVIIEGLGLFIWNAGSTELDDDETCFATASGRWLLAAIAPDYIFGVVEPQISYLDEIVASNTADIATNAADIATNASKLLFGSFTMSLTTLASTSSSDFIATVIGAAAGDQIVVTPGNLFGTSSTDRSRLSYTAYISATDTVTISIRNASGATAAMTASTWSVLVIKQ